MELELKSKLKLSNMYMYALYHSSCQYGIRWCSFSLCYYVQDIFFLHEVLTNIIVYPKDRPVSPLTARVTILEPAFFLIYGVEGGFGVERCLTRWLHHLWVGWGVSLHWQNTQKGLTCPPPGGRCICVSLG